MKRREVLKIMAEFPAIGGIGAFASPNPGRNDPTRYNLINADQIIAGSLSAQRIKGGGLEGTSIDIPEPGLVGFHVDVSGNTSIGATATDPLIALLVKDLSVTVIRNTGSGQAYRTWTETDSDYLFYISSSGTHFWAPSPGGTADVRVARDAASVLTLGGSIIGGNAFEMQEMSEPAAPSANQARLFLQDNGAGKTQLMIRFNTGASQQIAIQL